MTQLLSFLIYEIAVLMFAIWGVTHPEVTSSKAVLERQFVIFILDAFMAIGGMLVFINSWSKR